jgi:hypothetical protein
MNRKRKKIYYHTANKNPEKLVRHVKWPFKLEVPKLSRKWWGHIVTHSFCDFFCRILAKEVGNAPGTYYRSTDTLRMLGCLDVTYTHFWTTYNYDPNVATSERYDLKVDRLFRPPEIVTLRPQKEGRSARVDYYVPLVFLAPTVCDTASLIPQRFPCISPQTLGSWGFFPMFTLFKKFRVQHEITFGAFSIFWPWIWEVTSYRSLSTYGSVCSEP